MEKSVLITGAASGTGYAIAQRFAKENYNVFIGSRDAEKADSASRQIERDYGVLAEGFEMRVLDEENVRQIFTKIRLQGVLLDCLVLNAANLGIRQEGFSVDMKDFMSVIDTNICWNFMIARQAVLQMQKKGGGSIVFISSNTAYRSIPDRIAYSASKSGALGMMRAMALDWGKYNIRVNAVLPGMTKTDRWQNNYNDCKHAPSNYTPIGDIAEYDDIANAVWYFGSSESRNTTGAELTVDGGNMIQLYPIISHSES